MRALILLLLLAACSAPERPASVSAPVMGVLPQQVAERTTARREALVLAEHAYTGAVMAAELALASGALSDAQVMALPNAEARAYDALVYLRTLENTDEAGFTWALHFYGVSIRELNKVVEGDMSDPSPEGHSHAH